jgi:hypothetical protein
VLPQTDLAAAVVGGSTMAAGSEIITTTANDTANRNLIHLTILVMLRLKFVQSPWSQCPQPSQALDSNFQVLDDRFPLLPGYVYYKIMD